MMRQKPFSKLISIVLTLCLVLGMVSMTVFAEGDIPLEYSDGTATLSDITSADIVVAAFEELPDTVLYQGYDFGEITSQTEINLPETLTGTDTGNDPVSIGGVTWQSTPEFASATTGIYEFRPVLSKGYTASDSAVGPVITVIIRPEGGGIMPLDTPVSNEADLKSALEATAPDFITVTTDITLTETVNMGADHTISIDSGVTLTIGDTASGTYTLTVPSGTTLTIVGDGTLKVNNGTTVIGVMVLGDMVVDGAKLTAANSGDYTAGIMAAGSLSIENGSTLLIQNYGSNTGILGEVTIIDSTATITNTDSGSGGCKGINTSMLVIDNSNVTINTTINATGIYNTGGIVSLRNDSTVTIQGTNNGIHYAMNSGLLTIDASVLDIQSGLGLNLNDPSAVTFTGANGGIVKLSQGSMIKEVNGKMKDQGFALTSSDVTVGAADDTPSANGLTAGNYVWDSSYFTKSGSTGTISGTMDIGGTTVSNLSQDTSGTGWAWDAATATLTLGNGYLNECIVIDCDPNDMINIVLTDNISIHKTGFTGTDRSLWVNGSLNIKAGIHTLDVSSDWSGIRVGGNLAIESGIVKATGNDMTNGIEVSGDITISGSANVEVAGDSDTTGWGGNGLQAGGNILINTTGTVTTNGGKSGIYSFGQITLANGTVIANGGSYSGMTAVNGITVIGGNVTTNSIGSANGDVKCNLTVSGTGTNVRINGAIVNGIDPYNFGADLTVSNGNVTVTSTVAGTTIVTGGTVSVDGQNVPPSGGPAGPETITYPGVSLRLVNLGWGSYTAVAPSDGANGNTVTVNDTAAATNPDLVFGGWNTAGASTGNTTILHSGATVNNSVFGGFATNGGDATGNTVTLNSGAMVNVNVSGGWTEDAGSSSGNTVILHTGATVNGGVYGGLLASGMGITADNNTVTLHSGISVVRDVYGGSIAGLSPRGTGNKLELIGSGQNVGGDLKGFQLLGFTLPATTTAGSTVLTVGGEADISGATVSIGGTPAALTVGDTITLIDASAGTLTGTPINTTVSASGYTFSLSVSGNRLIATVTSGGGVMTYPLTVTNGIANPTSAAQGATVTLTASTAPSGQRFKQWNISPVLTFLDGTSVFGQTAKFTMPDQAVTATAEYENIPIGQTAVAGVSLDKTSLSLYSNTLPQTAALISTVSPSDATNKTVTWKSGNDAVATVDQSGNVTATGNGKAVISVITADGGYSAFCTVTVSTYQGGGGGNGSGISSGSSSYRTIVTSETGMPVTVISEIKGTVDKNGNLSLTVTDAMVRNAIEKAQTEARRLGKIGEGIVVEFKVTTTGGKSITATIDAAALSRLNTAGAGFSISGPVSQFTLNAMAVKEAATQSAGTVTFTATPVTKLSNVAEALIGSRPVFDFTMSYQKTGKTQYVSDFGKGTVTLGIPYTPAIGEKTGNLFMVYVDQGGKPQLLINSSYDNGWMIWSRNSLSTYGVGYKATTDFTDTTNHWAKDNIDFVVSRGLISGTTAATFAPNTTITRADFIMALGKLSGADVSGYKASSFTDMNAADATTPYIEWAVENKIVKGIGNNQFGPAQNITREQMAVMMQNYAKEAGYPLLAERQYNTFADDAKISTWAAAAVKVIVQAGIIVGKDGNQFDPQASATRAEASTILRRYVELVIDEGTARGWVKDDSGQWQYYNWQGKRTTGWLTITGTDAKYYFDSNGIMVAGKWVEVSGKWYYFYDDGKMARSAAIEDYKVDDNGVRQEK